MKSARGERVLRISQLTLPLAHSREDVLRRACREAGIRAEDVKQFQILKQSLDARKKENIKYSYTVLVTLNTGCLHYRKSRQVEEVVPTVYAPAAGGVRPLKGPAAVIGSGPAGLFCSYLLAKNGYRPLVLERGKPVEERCRDVEAFWNGGPLLPESNVQFGEGGAGTFSDGKLATSLKDKSGRNRFVLETFVRFGAPEDILYSAHPHIGTDVLRSVVVSMRREIIRLGGTFVFGAKVTDFRIENGNLTALQINGDPTGAGDALTVCGPLREELAAISQPADPSVNREIFPAFRLQQEAPEAPASFAAAYSARKSAGSGIWIPVSAAILAIGHSARDTFLTLRKRGVPMEAKPFAVGLRVEHPQEMISRSQYGEHADLALLAPAPYKLTYHTKEGRSVYTFCMCPGGFVVNASSEENRLAVNGMSYRARDAANANSAVVVSVSPQDFPEPADPFGGLEFQRELEARAYLLAGGKVPQQLFADFCAGRTGSGYGAFSSCVKGEAAFADLRAIFPETVSNSIVEGMLAFGGKIRGFDRPDAILSGVESRTSSPVRILRDENLQSAVCGLYPCGEGAGYAGGITSAAMDGLKVAERLMQEYSPLSDSIK